MSFLCIFINVCMLNHVVLTADSSKGGFVVAHGGEPHPAAELVPREHVGVVGPLGCARHDHAVEAVRAGAVVAVRAAGSVLGVAKHF